ncbi:ribosomal protein L18ae, partial [Coniophora puteana RWD-64-598 SS2]
TCNDPTPKIYCMRIFAPDEVVAKSRFWYFLRRSNEIIGVNVVYFDPLQLARSTWPSNVESCIWLRYNSHSGTYNMYEGFRELSSAHAVKRLYYDTYGTVPVFLDDSRLPFIGLQKSNDVRRPCIKHLLQPNLKLPLPHRVAKSKSKFVAQRPTTF